MKDRAFRLSPAPARLFAAAAGILLTATATHGALPTPLVNMRFSETTGTTTSNSGSLAGQAELVSPDASGLPALTNIVPSGPFSPSANTSAIDFGRMFSTNSGRAIDLTTTGGDGSGTLGALDRFTISGWLNARDLAVGPGGNRIVYTLDIPNGNGFDLVQLANGSLRLGINQWPDGANGGGPASPGGLLKADPQAGVSNWVFFAVTYDRTLATNQVKYYFGSPYTLANLRSSHNYKGLEIGTDGAIVATGPLSIGNFALSDQGARDAAGGNSRVFRGLMDEIKIYDVALDLAQIQEAQMNGAPPPVAVTITTQPANVTTFAGNSATFSVAVSGSAPYTFQWQRNGVDIAGATSETYSIDSAAEADNGAVFRVRVSNALSSNVLSDPATLTVLSDAGPRVALSFSDGDVSVTNTGTLQGQGAFVARDAFPVSSSKVPTGSFAPANNIASADFGQILAGQGARAIDLTNRYGNTAGPMKAFTVAGWVNSRDLDAGWGGNRLVFALASPGGPGFDVVQQEDGSVRLGVNQWPDAGAGGPASSVDKIKADPELGNANWVFFAVTYDSTLPDNNVSYYFGSPTEAAALDITATYLQGPITTPGAVTIGNFGPVAGARNELGPNGGSRVFRGLIDEVAVYGRALNLSEVQALQKAPAYKPVQVDPPMIIAQPSSQTTFAGQNATFNVTVSGTPPMAYQWYQQQGGAEQAISGATNQAFTVTGATLAQTGNSYWVVVSNQKSNAVSQRATLTVLPENNYKVSLSFSEGSGNSAANAGNLGGSANFAQNTGYPLFTTLVPAGPNAPTGNTSAVDFGIIGDAQGGRALDLVNGVGTTLGGMSAFTVSGWLNARDLDAGWGGNRIVFALERPDGPGFDLVQTEEGSLRLGINQWPDGANGGGPQSSQGKITADPDAGAANWVFFAVTYDSSLSAGQVSYYFGSPTQAAELDMAADYAQGPIVSSGSVTVGNFGSVVGARNELGPNGGSRAFRGIIDEVKVYSKALTLDEIRTVQKAPADAVVVASPSLGTALQQNQLRISWETQGNFQLQFRDSLTSGNWADETTAPVVTGNTRSVTVPATAGSRFFRLIRK